MEFMKERVRILISRFDEKQIKKLGLTSLLNLPSKLEDIEDPEVEELFREVVTSLENTVNEEKPKYKEFRSKYNNLKKLVRRKYGLLKRGEVSSEYIGFGIAIGVAIGAGLTSVNPGMMGVGIAIGVAIGAGIGSQKEKEAEKAGKLY